MEHLMQSMYPASSEEESCGAAHNPTIIKAVLNSLCTCRKY
jgi:hypothetical protein